MAAFACRVAALPVELTAVAAFPTEQCVLFLAPTPTRSLLELHRDFHDRLDQVGLVSTGYYRPGRWVPHCTLAQDLTPVQLQEAFGLTLQAFAPLQGRAAQVGIVSFQPVVLLSCHDLPPVEEGTG